MSKDSGCVQNQILPE